MGIGPKWSCGGGSIADNPSKVGGFSCNPDYVSGYVADTSPNPNPHNFNVIWAEVHNGHTIMMVRYPDCTTFDGQKLLLLRGVHPANMNTLDPHFLEGDHPVIARFLPTTEGIFLARTSALAL